MQNTQSRGTQKLSLSPLLFILVLEALSHEFRTGVPWELLYADDLAVIARHSGRVCVKAQGMEGGHGEKGLRVNTKKTKLIQGVPKKMTPNFDTTYIRFNSMDKIVTYIIIYRKLFYICL